MWQLDFSVDNTLGPGLAQASGCRDSKESRTFGVWVSQSFLLCLRGDNRIITSMSPLSDHYYGALIGRLVTKHKQRKGIGIGSSAMFPPEGWWFWLLHCMTLWGLLECLVISPITGPCSWCRPCHPQQSLATLCLVSWTRGWWPPWDSRGWPSFPGVSISWNYWLVPHSNFRAGLETFCVSRTAGALLSR